MRRHVGAWMVPSYDPELNFVYIGTSVTSPVPKFLPGGTDLEHLHHNSTLAHRRRHRSGDRERGAVFTAEGQEVLACPHATGGKDWEAGA